MFRICGFTTTYIHSNHRLLPMLYWYIEENLVSIVGTHIDIKYQTILISTSADTQQQHIPIFTQYCIHKYHLVIPQCRHFLVYTHIHLVLHPSLFKKFKVEEAKLAHFSLINQRVYILLKLAQPVCTLDGYSKP